eukprot:Awhi_evm1s927
MATLLLFHFPPSVSSMAVRLALEEKELEWHGRVINVLNFSNVRPEYTEFNEKM